MGNQRNKISEKFYNILVKFEEKLYNAKKQLDMSGISKAEIEEFENKILESTLVKEVQLCYDTSSQMAEVDARNIFSKQYIKEIETALESMITERNPLCAYIEDEPQM